MRANGHYPVTGISRNYHRTGHSLKREVGGIKTRWMTSMAPQICTFCHQRAGITTDVLKSLLPRSIEHFLEGFRRIEPADVSLWRAIYLRDHAVQIRILPTTVT